MASHDSALNLIRGEISKLREEIESAKIHQTPLTSTPRRPTVVENRLVNKPHDDASLQEIHDDIKVNTLVLFENKQ